MNKVNSKAILRWSVKQSDALANTVKQRFLNKYANRISQTGELVISSHRFRDQARNVSDCLAKLRAMILSVAEEPKRRKKTKISKAAKLRRLNEKRRRSLTKQFRKQPRLGDG